MRLRIVSTIAFYLISFVFCINAWGQIVTQPRGGGTSSLGIVSSDHFDMLSYGDSGTCRTDADDTAAFLAAITAAYNNHGGTVMVPVGPGYMCQIGGHVVMPNDGTAHSSPNPYSSQYPIRITSNAPMNTSAQGNQTISGGAILNLTYSGAGVAKIETYGLGRLEIDHLTLQDNAGDSLPIFFATGTQVHLHDNLWMDTTRSGTGCAMDAILLGGVNATFTNINDPTAAFQGDDSIIAGNQFNGIRRVLYGKTYAQGIHFEDNTIGWNSGSNVTTAITAATNASSAILTSAGHGLLIGSTPKLTVSGATGSWAPINGTHQVTVLDANTFSMSVDSTGFGSLTGSPVYFSGSAIVIDGTHGQAGNNHFVSNRLEINNYAFGAKFISANNQSVIGTDVEDYLGANTIALWYMDTNSQGNLIVDQTISALPPALETMDISGNNRVVSATQSGFERYPWYSTLMPYNVAARGFISLNVPGAATSGSNYATSPLYFNSSYWTGSASATDKWLFQPSLGSGANPASSLVLGHTGSSGTAYFYLNGVGFGLYGGAWYIDSSGNMTANGSNVFANNAVWIASGGVYSDNINSRNTGDMLGLHGSTAAGSGYQGTPAVRISPSSSLNDTDVAVQLAGAYQSQAMISLYKCGHWTIRGADSYPALTSCGTSPTLATGSSDYAGTFTIGATGTGCVATFGTAYQHAPSCTVGGANSATWSTSNTALTITAAPGTYFYQCIGLNE